VRRGTALPAQSFCNTLSSYADAPPQFLLTAALQLLLDAVLFFQVSPPPSTPPRSPLASVECSPTFPLQYCCLLSRTKPLPPLPPASASRGVLQFIAYDGFPVLFAPERRRTKHDDESAMSPISV
jgi:hypothetical protein